MDGKEIFAKTIYAEARGEPLLGQQWVGWVIKNRAYKNRSYWGGDRIADVCRKPGQFECWKCRSDIFIDQPEVYKTIRSWSNSLYNAPIAHDITGGCDHYNNPAKEGYPQWTRNVDFVRKIGAHNFYRTKPQLDH